MARDRQPKRREALPAHDLSDHEMALIREARVETDQPYTLGEIPDDDAS